MIVNDSLHVRTLLSDLVKSSSKLKLVAVARDGADAINKLQASKPDVVLLDLEMPNMDGLTFIDKVMKQAPIPIVVCSSYGTEHGTDMVFESLEAGAIDFIPLNNLTMTDATHKDDILSKIEQASNAILTEQKTKQKTYHDYHSKKEGAKCRPSDKIVVIGSSTGGPRVLSMIFSELPSDLSASILVIQHISKGFTSSLSKHLDSISSLSVEEAEDGKPMCAGTALVAPSDYHMSVTNSHTIKLDNGPKRHGVRPSINVSMVSAADVYGSNTVGLLLSGMGQDGAFGSVMIQRRGGKTFAQDEKSSVIFGMAKAAGELNAIQEFVPADKIASRIVRAVEAQ
jgi:two-component system chemotaxis response regulator CheB